MLLISGISWRRRTATSPISLDCASEVPGPEAREMEALPSLKEGRNSLPIIGQRQSDPASITEVATRTRKGWARAKRMKVCFTTFFIARTTKPSPWSLPAFGWMRSEQSTGMTVRETTKEAAMLVIVAMAMGGKRRPSIPSSPKSGRKTRMMRTVA
jgi:hypothetical protein